MKQNNKKHRQVSVFRQELSRDWNTFKSLSWKKRLGFLWDYYKWPAAAGIFLAAAVITFASMLWEGQKPCRLRVCVVLPVQQDCASWFQPFTEKLRSDGKPGAVEFDFDQLFYSDDPYHNVQEMKVMSTISSRRMDAAVCSEDLYRYLLSLNACLPLDQALSSELFSSLLDSRRLVCDTAGQAADSSGGAGPETGTEGYYAADLSDTPFFRQYCQTADGDETLYAVIISNTEHLEDCQALLDFLLAE